MNVLLTGATGFLGSHVLAALLSRGHVVHTLGRRPILERHPNLTCWQIDRVGHFSADGFPWDEIDAVAHLAASGVKSSHRVWSEALEFNVLGTQRLLDIVERCASRRPVFLLARTFYEHLVEQATALLDNPYIATKRAAAELTQLWAQRYDGTVVMATVFQVYGPDDHGAHVLTYAARQIMHGRPAIFGSGRGLRDWIFVTDAADLIAHCIEEGRQQSTPGLLARDVGSGRLDGIRSIVERMAELATEEDILRLCEQCSSSGGTVVPGGVDPRALLTFDPGRDRPDVDLVLAASRLPVKWTPAVSLDEGLRRMLFAAAAGSLHEGASGVARVSSAT